MSSMDPRSFVFRSILWEGGKICPREKKNEPNYLEWVRPTSYSYPTLHDNIIEIGELLRSLEKKLENVTPKIERVRNETAMEMRCENSDIDYSLCSNEGHKVGHMVQIIHIIVRTALSLDTTIRYPLRSTISCFLFLGVPFPPKCHFTKVRQTTNHPSHGGVDGQTTRSDVSKRFHVEFFSQNDSTRSFLVRATVTSLKTSQTEPPSVKYLGNSLFRPK